MIPAFYKLKCLPETGSTNDDAKSAAEAGQAEGLVIQALTQNGGKGRRGRPWSSPAGNLYTSILLRPACDAQTAGLYSFAAALAVYDTVRIFLPDAKIEVKWPNDVLVEGKKICGILLESAPAHNNQLDWLVVGAGINVFSHPDDTLYPVTDLSSQRAEITDLSSVLEIYLENFEKWRLNLVDEGFDSLRKVWIERARKGAIIARLPNEEIKGQFIGLDKAGRLLLELKDGSTKSISAADIFFNEDL